MGGCVHGWGLAGPLCHTHTRTHTLGTARQERSKKSGRNKTPQEQQSCPGRLFGLVKKRMIETCSVSVQSKETCPLPQTAKKQPTEEPVYYLCHSLKVSSAGCHHLAPHTHGRRDKQDTVNPPPPHTHTHDGHDKQALDQSSPRVLGPVRHMSKEVTTKTEHDTR